MNGIFGIGIAELFFIAVIALVVLGPERLPSTLRELAKYFRMARNLSGELTSQFSEELKALDDINPQKIIQEVLDDPSMDDLSLDDINPTKISKDLAKDEAKNRKQTTAKKAKPKKPAAKKPATQSATDSKPLAETSGKQGAAEAATEEAVTAAEDAVVAGTTAVASEGAVSKASDDESPSQPDKPTSEQDDTPEAGVEAAVDEDVEDNGMPENRIAPDNLAANLEQDEPPSEAAVSSEPASLSVNGTHDSVEDRA